MKYTDSQIVHVQSSTEEKARLSFLSLPEFDKKNVILTMVGTYQKLNVDVLEHWYVFSYAFVQDDENK